MAGEEQDGQAAADPSEDPGAEDQPMNRAERRALEHNKKSAAKPGAPGSRPSGPGAHLSRGGGNIQSRLSRTGHK